MRVQYPSEPGMLGKVASAIGTAGGTIGAVDLVSNADQTIRDITVETKDASDWPKLTAAVSAVERGAGARHDRPHVPHAPGRQDRDSQ